MLFGTKLIYTFISFSSMQLRALDVCNVQHQLYKTVVISSDSGYVGKETVLINTDIKDKGGRKMKHLAL